MSEQWYYGENGEQRGPVSMAALRGRLAAGLTRGEDLVWRDGMAEWAAAASVPELADIVAAPAGPVALSPGVAGMPAETLGYYNDAGALVGLEFVGFWWRVLAYIIDYLVLWLLMMPVTLLLGLSVMPGSRQHLTLSLGVSGLNLVVWWLYFALMESSAQQASLGKMAIGARVVDAAGGRLTFGHATGRALAKFLSILIFYIGCIIVAFTQRKQGLHDLMASTYVVRGRANVRGFDVAR